MGLIQKKIKLCSEVRREGRAAKGTCREVLAAFDTGAAKSILHPRVAPRDRGPEEPVRTAGGFTLMPTTLAFLEAPGCPAVRLTPWVGREGPEALGVDVVVGADYMEVARLVPVPETGSARCRPHRGRRAP